MLGRNQSIKPKLYLQQLQSVAGTIAPKLPEITDIMFFHDSTCLNVKLLNRLKFLVVDWKVLPPTGPGAKLIS